MKFTQLLAILFFACQTPRESVDQLEQDRVIIGAERTEKYLPILEGKRVGLLVNHTSRVGESHLVDTLINLGIEIPTVFAPEHGFRGTADAGEHVKDEITDDFKVISLFGESREPSDQDVEGLDIIVFDIQDVGTRFYTYISSMHYLMDAAARNNIPFIVLDRPNPNGSYVDGPFLEENQRSFVGVHPIPIVHGMTVGELAKMIVAENWLPSGETIALHVIPMENWTHDMTYSLPIKPSPNLPNDLSIALYPGLCLFEGTKVSVGRGTPTPFQHIGHPDYPDTSYAFIPKPMEGAKEPKLNAEICFGVDFTESAPTYGFDIEPLIDFYNKLGQPDDFFNSYFKLLAGDMDEQIRSGMSSQEIRETWQDDLASFKNKRSMYLLYN